MLGVRRVAVAGLVVLGVVLAGCAAAPEVAGPAAIVPGGPGEAAQVLPGAEAAERRTPPPVSPADVEFVAAMVPHHQQALEMAALAPGRAADPQVLAMAERITAAQGPEITMMRALLAEQDDALGGHSGGHGGGHAGELHPGMATAAQLDALEAAGGPAFDRMFLELMIVHHEGALAMADALRAGGTDVRVSQMADDVTVTQSAEIERMRSLLA